MPAPYAIFCANPLDPRSVEPDFSLEFAGAGEAGFSPILIDHDELDQRIGPRAALRKTRIGEPGCRLDASERSLRRSVQCASRARCAACHLA
jgi:hypothetical protein